MRMQIHGHHVDSFKGRFSGTVDEVDEEAFKFDRMVVMLVVARTSLGGVDVRDDGEVQATMKIKVTDMQPLEGQVRDQAIAYLAHGANQGILDFGNYQHKGDEPKPPKIEGQGALPVADYAQLPDGDQVDANGERVAQPATGTPKSKARIIEDPDAEFDVPPATPTPVAPRPDDVDPPAYQPPPEPSPQPDGSMPPPSGNRVGTTRTGRRDKTLEAFLNE